MPPDGAISVVWLYLALEGYLGMLVAAADMFTKLIPFGVNGNSRVS